MRRKKTLILPVVLCCALFAEPRGAAASSSDCSNGRALPPPNENLRRKTATAPLPPRQNPPFTFEGVGSKTGRFDTGFRRENPRLKKNDDEEKPSGIELSPALQKILDDADHAIEKIDEATLDAVNVPLKALGLEAESAELRPSHGGVNLDISIKLHRQKKLKEEKGEKRALPAGNPAGLKSAGGSSLTKGALWTRERTSRSAVGPSSCALQESAVLFFSETIF